MGKALTTEEFIERAMKVHGDKYDYSLVDYNHHKQHIDIVCKKHGVFSQTPQMHRAGQGCAKCHFDNLKGVRDPKRKKAIDAGDMFYYGKPCTKGHKGKRYTKNKSCTECAKESRREWMANNKERHKEMHKAWAINNPEEAKTRMRISTALRRRSKRNGSKMLTTEMRTRIKEVHLLKYQMEDKYNCKLNVDHIIPLQGVNVCGLHVPWNLQITTESYNCTKNRYRNDYEPVASDWRTSVLIHESATPWNLRR